MITIIILVSILIIAQIILIILNLKNRKIELKLIEEYRKNTELKDKLAEDSIILIAELKKCNDRKDNK